MLVLLYLGVTGTIVQLVDLRALVTHAPATAPDMMAIRESIDGTSNYAVIAAPDYAAPAFNADYDWHAGLARVMTNAHAVANGRPWRRGAHRDHDGGASQPGPSRTRA